VIGKRGGGHIRGQSERKKRGMHSMENPGKREKPKSGGQEKGTGGRRRDGKHNKLKKGKTLNWLKKASNTNSPRGSFSVKEAGTGIRREKPRGPAGGECTPILLGGGGVKLPSLQESTVPRVRQSSGSEESRDGQIRGGNAGFQDGTKAYKTREAAKNFSLRGRTTGKVLKKAISWGWGRRRRFHLGDRTGKKVSGGETAAKVPVFERAATRRVKKGSLKRRGFQALNL